LQPTGQTTQADPSLDGTNPSVHLAHLLFSSQFKQSTISQSKQASPATLDCCGATQVDCSQMFASLQVIQTAPVH